MQAAEAKERLEVAVTGTFAAQKIEACGDVGEKAKPTVANMDAVQSPIENWSPMSKKAAEQTLDKYGPPNEAIPSRLIWYHNGPWKRTIVYRDEMLHNFQSPHTDVIEQFIDYQVPPEKFSEWPPSTAASSSKGRRERCPRAVIWRRRTSSRSTSCTTS